MKVTSAQVSKILRSLVEEYNAKLENESNSREFIASLGEDPETVRPSYDYPKARDELEELEGKIRKIKHALNVFNSTCLIPELGMTIDEALIYIPQLTRTKTKLAEMKAKLPKSRIPWRGSSSIVDYLYLNYNVNEVEEDFRSVSKRLSEAQLALDNANTSNYLEIEI